jgi:hypothetical protein
MSSERICVYCGAIATTDDHIPPRCLYGKNKPSNLVTVPACEDCNQGASMDDQYAMRLAAVEGAERTKAGEEVNEAFERSLQRPQAAGMSRSFYESTYPVEVFTQSGLFVRHGVGFDVQPDRITTLMNRLIRGFFWKLFDRRLAEGYRTDWHPIAAPPKITPEQFQNQETISRMRYCDYGDGAFRLRCIPSPKDANLVLFRFDFFLTHGFIGYTGFDEGNGRIRHFMIEPAE